MTSCHFCDKTNTVGNNVPHSKKKTKRRIGANLQNRRVDGKRVKMCTRCIKSL
ncbi:MAG TPA: 50S ribosomal protein L28 [Candidatus Jacksonbacteria bacterium]|nr:50S ribosomal protein L28 [Candidatus Jacksonbacteria bacterium]